MAKRNKNEPREGLPLPPQVSIGILGVFALLALLGGVGILWQTWRASNTESLGPRLEQLRTSTAAAITRDVLQMQERLDVAIQEPRLRADVAAGEFEDAVARLRTDWPDVGDVALYASSLDDPFSEELAAVGFGKLALLTAAVNERASRVGVVGKDAALSLGLAAPIPGDDGEPLAVAYGTVPLDTITGSVRAVSLPGGYLELRSGQRVLVQMGDSNLRFATESTMIEGIALQIATAAPEFVSTLPYSKTTQLGLGIGALLMGALLVWKLLKTLQLASSRGREVEPTFAEALRQSELEAERAPAAAARRAPPGPAPEPAAKKPALALDRSIFRAYDIRGVLGKTLSDDIARLLGQAIGTVMAERNLREVVVGRDGRLSGPELSDALIEGLRLAGRDVIDIGMAPTPVVYFASYQLHTGSCVAVTGSHNPPDYNGFKIVLGGETLAGEAIEDLYFRIIDGLLDRDGGGGLQSMDVSSEYISRIASDVQLERPIKVVVDAGNGVAGVIGPQVLEAIGAEVMPLYCDIDGEFPNHHPDPSDPENLRDLIHLVQKFEADIGLAFDGDGDRLGVVTREGEVIYPDRLLMLFARDVLMRNPGATIIYDVKCTGHLAGQILRNGGSPIMWKTGHSLIKAKMRETEAELAGEMSGHFFFRERWFGFDDGIYSAARLLEILAADDRSPEEVFAELPKGASTPELKVPMEEGAHYAYVREFVEKARFEDAKISTIDGLRADWPDGWGLVRCSNTTPSLVLRFDADDEAALARIQQAFREQLLAVDPDLALPF
ncbi:phosphomannomutase/phosphoglucomutase [Denitratimonas tolerans]|uniref:phosphomannomutase n=1 Tax=Denitratimonas tolerans TaxID=1338420 RepID=A0AAW9R7E6_9GAMM